MGFVVKMKNKEKQDLILFLTLIMVKVSNKIVSNVRLFFKRQKALYFIVSYDIIFCKYFSFISYLAVACLQIENI